MANEADRPNPDRPTVSLVGADGNAFSILGLCLRAARDAGWSAERIAAFRADATSGDYDHLPHVVQQHFDVR